jgi:hypothetical protein
MPETKRMSLSSLKAMLASEKADALAAMSAAQLSGERARAQEYYLGDMDQDMPAAEGRSRAVSSDVADTIEGLMPSLMDIFCGSDDVVRFEPVGPEDDAGAQQESDYVNHVFMQLNPGFMVTYSFVKDALLSKVGVVKVYWDEREQEERETYLDQSDDSFALLAQAVVASDGALEIIAHTEKTDPATSVITHDVTLLKTRRYAQAKVEGVPPEEFGIERGARRLSDCNYCFHDVIKSESALIAQGFDAAQIKAITPYTGLTEIETLARDTAQEHLTTVGGNANPAGRMIKVTEHYVRMDYEGTGKASLYQVTTGGDLGDILRKDGAEHIVPFDAIPFAAMTPVPVTHRFFGRSVADLVLDIQRIKTALLRGMLDNLYLRNHPRVEVAEQYAGPNTLDDLLVSRPGGVVRVRQPGGIAWQEVPDLTPSIYPALDYLDTVREMRTGVTRQSQGVDANALQNQSATAVAQAFSLSQAKMKLIAKILAETGIRDMFALLHATIRKHGQQSETVRLRNQWVTVDPRNWKTRNDMTINVGLGTGGKAERFAHLMAIVNLQKEAVGAGKVNLVDDAKLYNSVSQLTRLLDYKNADLFFNNPSTVNPDGTPKFPLPAPPPPGPDPAVLRVQAQAQSDHAKLQADAAHQQLKLQGETQLAQRKAELEAQLMLVDAGLRERVDKRAQELHVLDLQHRRERHQIEMAKSGFKLAPMFGATPDDTSCSCNSNQSENHDEVTTNEPSCSCQS